MKVHKKKKKMRFLIPKLVFYILISAIAVIMVLPFYWMLITSVSPIRDILAFPPKWIPSHLAFGNFIEVFNTAPFHLYYLNSFLVAVICVGCSVFLGLFAAYAFAVYRFPLQNFFFLLILSTIMIPFQVTSVALYILLAKMGWINTLWGIVAPNFASALGIFLIRQGIKTIPIDLIEAARLDGSSEMRIVLTIIAPLIKPMLATVAMILFLNSWNDFLWPVIVINSANLRTIPVGLALFKDPYGSMDYGPLMAATVISVGPLLLVYFFSQKFIIKGIAMTGLKG